MKNLINNLKNIKNHVEIEALGIYGARADMVFNIYDIFN